MMCLCLPGGGCSWWTPFDLKRGTWEQLWPALVPEHLVTLRRKKTQNQNKTPNICIWPRAGRSGGKMDFSPICCLSLDLGSILRVSFLATMSSTLCCGCCSYLCPCFPRISCCPCSDAWCSRVRWGNRRLLVSAFWMASWSLGRTCYRDPSRGGIGSSWTCQLASDSFLLNRLS